MARHHGDLGGAVGPRLASIVHRAVLAAKVEAAPHAVRTGMHLQEQFFRLVGTEIQDTLGPLFTRVAEHESTPGWAKRTLAFLEGGMGQWQTFLATHVGGAILSGGLGLLVNNELGEAVHALVAENPQGIMDPPSAAQAVARKLIEYSTGEREAAFGGINGTRFARLVDLAQAWPDPSTTFELLRRGLIDNPTAREWMFHSGIAGETVDILLDLTVQHLSPPVLADMVVRGILTADQAAVVALKSGVSEDDFHLLTLDTGEAPGPQQLLEAYRRGKIDRGRLEHGIRQTRIRDEWIDLYLALQFEPAGAGTAVAAAVQNQLPHDEARAKAAEAGLDPADFDWVLATHGRPPGIMEMVELWRRGRVTREEVAQAIRESDVKDKYVDTLLHLYEQVLPMRTIGTVYAHGAFTEAQALERLGQLGYTPQDAAAILASHSTEKTARVRDLSATQVRELYRLHALTEDAADRMLAHLGYSAQERRWLLELDTMLRAERMRSAAVNRIRALYVGHHIDANTASTALDRLAVDAALRDDLLGLWQLEADANVKQLSEAHVLAAWRYTGMDDATARGLLGELGYTDRDVAIVFDTWVGRYGPKRATGGQ